MTVRGKKQKNEPINVGSARSRKSGQIEQERHIKQIKGLVKNLEKLMGEDIQLQVEPIIPIKKDKKKLN